MPWKSMVSDIAEELQSFETTYEEMRIQTLLSGEYDKDNAIDLDFAYACTVHKSQGNEFEAVIIPMFKGAPQLYYRNLLYTAVTRAKKCVTLVGNDETFNQMIQNNIQQRRYSGLKDRLLEGNI